MALHRARSALPSFVCLFVCFAPFYRCRISNGVAEYCITSFLLSSSSLSSSSIVYLLPAALSEGWIPFCGSLKLGQPGSKFSHHSPTFARVLCCASYSTPFMSTYKTIWQKSSTSFRPPPSLPAPCCQPFSRLKWKWCIANGHRLVKSSHWKEYTSNNLRRSIYLACTVRARVRY